MVAFQDIVMVNHAISEIVDVPLVTDRDADESRYILADLFAIQKSLIAFDDATGFQFFHSLQDSGCGQLNFFSDVRKTGPPVNLKNIEYF